MATQSGNTNPFDGEHQRGESSPYIYLDSLDDLLHADHAVYEQPGHYGELVFGELGIMSAQTTSLTPGRRKGPPLKPIKRKLIRPGGQGSVPVEVIIAAVAKVRQRRLSGHSPKHRS